MSGGVGFIVQGNMACGVNKDEVIVRVGPLRYEEALAHPHARPFGFIGKPTMQGWIVVGPGGYESEGDFTWWVQQSVDFALSLPPK